MMLEFPKFSLKKVFTNQETIYNWYLLANGKSISCDGVSLSISAKLQQGRSHAQE